MIPIKHILYEYGVKEVFKLIVPSGNFAGTYEIEKPDGWDDVNSVIDVDEDLFFVKNFIIGDTEKLKFMEYGHKKAFTVLKNVYKEQGIDGIIHFKWIAVKEGVEYDLLKDNFDVNMNKYSKTFEGSMFKIEIEIIKSESQNKLLNRDETTVNLFAVKDLEENVIAPVQTFDIGYKKGDRRLSNFYTYDISQSGTAGSVPNRYKNGFFSFRRSDDFEFGNNTNQFASYLNFSPIFPRKYQGDFVTTAITLPSLKVEISNMHIYVVKSGSSPNASLIARYKLGENTVKTQVLKNAVPVSGGGIYSEIKIDNEIFSLDDNLLPGHGLTFDIVSNEDALIGLIPAKDTTSIEITTNLESPLVKTKGVRLISALDQLVKNCTSSGLSVISNFIGLNGPYYNTSISTGVYLRGLPAVYLNQKIRTSFKNLLSDGVAKLLALGFDIVGNKVVVEDINYFFKDLMVYDLSEKIYLHENFKIENDKDVVFNSMVFGSKKYSTKVREDIKNFTTSAEFATPIKSIKNKFDKETELIIDEFKIQELIEDKSTSTNDNDDDLVLIDMVNLTDYYDNGVFENCVHSVDGGVLQLNCTSTPFDTTMIAVGVSVQITEGLNEGIWTVLSIDLSKMKLNKTTGIQEGINDTPIRYKIASLTKNRTDDGFTEPSNIRDFKTATNIRHNPKYQMARWFPLFGSGLRKKANSESIKVTKYKNNSEAQMRINSPALLNELQGLVKVGADETLGRLRSYSQTLFNGDIIEISYTQISFEEFFMIYDSWKSGLQNDRNKSRGYIRLNTPDGIFDAYPFGDAAFSHDRKTNVLTIKAKVKGKSVDNPTLISVTQIDKKKVNLVWNFNNEYINPVSRIQYSLDGTNWITLEDVNNLKTKIVESDVFLSIITGTIVYFRVVVSTADYSNKVSNTLQIVWQFNNWTFKEVGRQVNFNCGYSQLELEIKGTVSLDFEAIFECYPGGGTGLIKDFETNATLATFTAPYGPDYIETQNFNISLTNQTKRIYIVVKNSDKTNTNQILNCNSGNTTYYVISLINLTITEVGTTNDIFSNIIADNLKKYNNRPPIDFNPNPE